MIFTEDVLRVGLDVQEWQQAVREIGAVMVDAGLTKATYTEAMINTIQQLGPYAVIAPGIAMPHARPEDGVVKTGFALATLKTPVEFGNSENDPVDIVVAFSAIDKENHVEALVHIANLLSDQQAVNQIRHSETIEQLLDATRLK